MVRTGDRDLPEEKKRSVAASPEEAEAAEAPAVIEILLASESKYRALFTSLDEGFSTIEVFFDAQGKAYDYLFLETNPAFEKQTGVKNAVGRTARDLVPEHEDFWFEAFGHVARSGEALRFEHEAAALGKFYEVYAFRIGEPGENRVAVIFNDILARIAERRRAEERQALVQAVAAQLRSPADPIEVQIAAFRLLADHLETERVAYAEIVAAMFAALPVGVGFVDLAGRLVYANRRMQDYLPNGIVPSRDATALPRWRAFGQDGTLVPPNDFPTARAIRGETIVPGLEMLFTEEDGSEVWTRVSTVPVKDRWGRVAGIVAVIADIDAKKRSQGACGKIAGHEAPPRRG